MTLLRSEWMTAESPGRRAVARVEPTSRDAGYRGEKHAAFRASQGPRSTNAQPALSALRGRLQAPGFRFSLICQTSTLDRASTLFSRGKNRRGDDLEW